MNAVLSPSATASATAEAEIPSISEIEKVYFSPSQLSDPAIMEAINKVGSILAQNGQTPIMNFSPEAGPESGFGIIILPISERDKVGRGNIVTKIAICQMPDPTTIAQHEQGADFISGAILRLEIAKLSSAVRTGAMTLPASIIDFIVSAKAGEGLATFNELAGAFVKTLKQMGLLAMSKPLLRQCFSSSEFAAEQFSKIAQEKWVFLLNLMKKAATKDQLDPAILDHWLTTRDNTHVDMKEDFDEEAFSKLM